MFIDTEPSVKNRLRQLRRSRGLPLYGLAVKAGVSPTIVGMVERFDYIPGAKVRQRLANTLGVREAEIWPASAAHVDAREEVAAYG